MIRICNIQQEKHLHVPCYICEGETSTTTIMVKVKELIVFYFRVVICEKSITLSFYSAFKLRMGR